MTADDEDSSVVEQRPGCSASENKQRLGRGILDAFSCLCIGSADASDYIDENERSFGEHTPKTSTPRKSSSPRDVTQLIQPVAYYVADHETGALLKRPHRTTRSSSFPASRFVFRPVSDEETTVTGFESQSRGWEV